jgi:hypothetical protein
MKVKTADQGQGGLASVQTAQAVAGQAAAERAKPAAQAMPVCAALVDEMRRVWGVDVVNRALAASQQARRAYAAIQAEKGQPAADAWLKRQKWPHGRVWLQEGGREVGVQACG